MTEGSPPHRYEHVLREEAPRVLGALVRRTGDFAAAEDAVQEALIAAHVEWAAAGVPANPGGWLYRVALRRVADQRASERARREREARAAAATPERADSETAAMHADDTLLLLHLCCHPALSPPSAIALTLRAVGGLTTAEIARAFLVPEATMAQRIARAKQAITASSVPFALPAEGERDARLALVLHVLYLVFNEGYLGSGGPELVRADLSTEAIRLARALHRVQPEHAETAGLLALMLLTDARRRARTGPLGELVPLHEQDRTRWDRAAIAEGTAIVTAALGRGAPGPYQVQAAIAALHDEAASVATTDWREILALYRVLERMTPGPVVALNRAVAEAMVHGPEAGLAAVDALAASDHYRVDAVRAHLLELAGDRAAAIRHYRAAASRTPNEAERHYLATKAARLAHGGADERA